MAQHSTGARRAPQRRDPQGPLEDLISSQELSVLRGVASSPRLTEDLALLLLNRRDLPPAVLEDLARNPATMRHRKVIMAVVSHPRTPRHVTLPMARHLHTFELMQLALTPAVAADIKLAVEETLVSRLETIPAGERMSLARRGSARIAAALLADPETRVIEAALDNPHLTEVWVVKAVMRPDSSQPLVRAVCNHRKWSLRRDVQVALLRSPQTPLARAIALAASLPVPVVRDVLHHSCLAPNIKAYLAGQLRRRAVTRHKKTGEGPTSPSPADN